MFLWLQTDIIVKAAIPALLTEEEVKIRKQ